MYFNIKNLISLILYIYNNLAANILVALIEKNNYDGENNECELQAQECQIETLTPSCSLRYQKH